MSAPSSWSATSFNQVPDSTNRIHSDEIARRHGFEGALVPGVTVSAYLLHPAVVAWGTDWLTRGHARAVVSRPLYDDRAFDVQVTSSSDSGYDATLTDAAGTLCATVTANLPAKGIDEPTRRGDPPVTGEKVPATPEGLARLRDAMGSLSLTWSRTHPMATYLRDPSTMPALLSPDGDGLANGAFVLGATNWLLAANVALGPWLHLQTESWHFAPIVPDSTLFIEGRVTHLFERKGHEFVDLETALFFEDGRPAARVDLRAIYRLRQ